MKSAKTVSFAILLHKAILNQYKKDKIKVII